jgi:hypothetical protein
VWVPKNVISNGDQEVPACSCSSNDVENRDPQAWISGTSGRPSSLVEGVLPTAVRIRFFVGDDRWGRPAGSSGWGMLSA